MNNKGYTIIELLIVIAVFSLAYFITVNKVSYAFSEYTVNDQYDAKILLITKQAELYGKNNDKIFKDDNTVYLFVKDLIEAKYLIGNDDGEIKDPRDNTKSLNNLKIKIEKSEDGNIKATTVEEV